MAPSPIRVFKAKLALSKDGRAGLQDIPEEMCDFFDGRWLKPRPLNDPANMPKGTYLMGFYVDDKKDGKRRKGFSSVQRTGRKIETGDEGLARHLRTYARRETFRAIPVEVAQFGSCLKVRAFNKRTLGAKGKPEREEPAAKAVAVIQERGDVTEAREWMQQAVAASRRAQLSDGMIRQMLEEELG